MVEDGSGPMRHRPVPGGFSAVTATRSGCGALRVTIRPRARAVETGPARSHTISTAFPRGGVWSLG
jgi:hypothetical protein